MQNTEPNHPDYAWLQKSLSSMKAVAADINDSILEEERRMKCVEVSKLFVISNEIKWSSDRRYLLYQGTVTKQCHNKRADRELFLFNDTLLYGRTLINQHYNILGVFELETVVVESENDDQNAVMFLIRSPKKSFYCIADSPTEKNKWIQELTGAIKKRKSQLLSRLSFCGENQPALPSPKAAVWEVDTSTTACTICGKQFTLLTVGIIAESVAD